MLYAISDIHGYYDELIELVKQVDLDGGDRLIFLGDYIDYGQDSFKVLEYVYNLQKKYGKEKVIALKGNHEDAFINWIDEYKNPARSGYDELLAFNDWLRTELETGAKTFRTFVSEEDLKQLEKMASTASFYEINATAVRMVLSRHKDLIAWMKKLPLFYETEKYIFVHAGIKEEAGDLWAVGTPREYFMYKYPPTVGAFHKTIVAGHVGTHSEDLSNNPDFHDIFYDGQSHYYIDGSVYEAGGKLNLFCTEDEE